MELKSVKMVVVKKRCNFCLKIKPDNLQPEQKVLNKGIKDVLEQISGIEISTAQMQHILICYDCAISIIQAEPIVVKVRTLIERLTKRKRKKSLTNDNTSANASIQDKSTLQEGDDEARDANDSVKMTPLKIRARRKSVAKKLVDSIVNDELEGSPAASSTIAGNAIAVEIKSTPKEKHKPTVNENGEEPMPTPKKTKKRKISEKSNNNSQEKNSFAIKTPKKDAAMSSENSTTNNLNVVKSEERKISEMSYNISQEKNQTIKTPKTDKTVSPTKPKKGTISEKTDDSSQEEINDSSQLFKKLKDPDEKKLLESQHSTNGETVKECMDCGKIFRHSDKYEAHVNGQKCKRAGYKCKHPFCMRRFFKLQKMFEHMQQKHPEMDDTEMD